MFIISTFLEVRVSDLFTSSIAWHIGYVRVNPDRSGNCIFVLKQHFSLCGKIPKKSTAECVTWPRHVNSYVFSVHATKRKRCFRGKKKKKSAPFSLDGKTPSRCGRRGKDAFSIWSRLTPKPIEKILWNLYDAIYKYNKCVFLSFFSAPHKHNDRQTWKSVTFFFTIFIRRKCCLFQQNLD